MWSKHSSASLTFLLLAAVGLTACEADSYDKGDGKWSHTIADFAELWADGQKRGVSFVTDDGASFVFDQAVKASWIKTGDSTYRTSIYYNPIAEGVAHPVACSQTPTVRAKEPSEFSRQPQDPLSVESCWMSKNGKYLNLALLLKNGRNSEGSETTHVISLVHDGTRQNSDQTQTACYRLLHDKRDAPEYYTNRHYVSILLPSNNRPDSVELTIKTYQGNWIRKMKI